MNGKIVIGSAFGDEGKGLSTAFLCSITKNPLVVRFNGGHQAGHTVVHNNQRHVFSSFGSGTLQGIPTYWSKYCTLYPIALVNEYEFLKKLKPILFVNPLCPITTPYDVRHNRYSEKQNNHGSVGVGFGATIKRQESYYKLFAQDLFHEKILLEKLKNIASYYGIPYNSEYEIDNFMDYISMLKEIITIHNDDVINHSIFNPIFEGAQGILLDQDFGFFPNVTRSNTTTKNALELYDSKEVFYVTRTYQTRHGNGFMTNEDKRPILINNENENNKEHEYQGDFRIGGIDTDLLNYAYECDNNFSRGLKKNLIITCTDQLEIDIDKLILDLRVKFENVYISTGDTIDKMKLYKGKGNLI